MCAYVCASVLPTLLAQPATRCAGARLRRHPCQVRHGEGTQGQCGGGSRAPSSLRPTPCSTRHRAIHNIHRYRCCCTAALLVWSSVSCRWGLFIVGHPPRMEWLGLWLWAAWVARLFGCWSFDCRLPPPLLSLPLAGSLLPRDWDPSLISLVLAAHYSCASSSRQLHDVPRDVGGSQQPDAPAPSRPRTPT